MLFRHPLDIVASFIKKQVSGEKNIARSEAGEMAKDEGEN